MVWGKLFCVAFACACVTVFSADASAQTKQFSGTASFYNQPGKVASGGNYHPYQYTCAHRTLPFGTKLRVTDRKTKRSVVVTVNDRGPFVGGRNLDLSLAAARALGMTARGLIDFVAHVQYTPRTPWRYGGRKPRIAAAMHRDI